VNLEKGYKKSSGSEEYIRMNSNAKREDNGIEMIL